MEKRQLPDGPNSRQRIYLMFTLDTLLLEMNLIIISHLKNKIIMN